MCRFEPGSGHNKNLQDANSKHLQIFLLMNKGLFAMIFNKLEWQR